MKGVITSNKMVLVNDEIFKFSKTIDKTKLNTGDVIEVFLDYEYPESCDNNPFCDGDETCIICLYNNKVAFLKI